MTQLISAMPEQQESRLRSTLNGVRSLAVLPVLILVFLVGAGIQGGVFLQPANLINILFASSALGIVVVAESLILICGKFDLSLESVVGLAPMVGAWLVVSQSTGGLGVRLPVWAGLVIPLLLGLIAGLVNGLLVVYLRLNAFIVTLATLILYRGVMVGVSGGATIYGLPPAFLFLGSAEWFGVPVAVWVATCVIVAAGLFLRYHRVGRALYAIGGNKNAARAAGIPVERITLACFAVAGGLSALAGLMLTGRVASVTAEQGNNMIFTVMAAAVIGGVSLQGGRGRILGVVVAILLLGVVSNLLTLIQVPSYWVDASYGAIILISLIVARTTGREEPDD